MGNGIGIGIGIAPNLGNSDPSPFFEILAENGDYIISEGGVFLVLE
jgi:hypothetical protein